MIFYLAITPTIVDLKTITLADYGILVALTIVVLLVVLVPYLALAAKARWFLKIAARAEGAEPHRRRLHGRRGRGDCRPPIDRFSQSIPQSAVPENAFPAARVFSKRPTRYFRRSLSCAAKPYSSPMPIACGLGAQR